MYTKEYIITILLGGTSFGSAILCYNCTSTDTGVMCDDPPDLSQIPLIECTPETALIPANNTEYMCFKAVVVEMTDVLIKTEFLRFCGGPVSEDSVACDLQILDLVSNALAVTDCEFCSEDGCNNITAPYQTGSPYSSSTVPPTETCEDNCPGGGTQYLQTSLSVIIITMSVITMLSGF